MIYVLIPARDEASTVGLLLWKVRQAFTAFSREYQIIVVNDGSRDASEDVLAPYTRALPLTLLSHRDPRGYAASLEALLRAAVQRTDRPRRDLAVTLQADFSESPDDLVELVKRLEAGADIAVPDRRQSRFSTRMARFAHRALNALLRRRLGLAQVGDMVGTMRAYRLAVIDRLVRQYGATPFVSGEGWAADISLLARAARHARTIDSVPLDSVRPAGARTSRASPLRAAWEAFRVSGPLRRQLAAPQVAAPQQSDSRLEAQDREREPRGRPPRDRRDKDRPAREPATAAVAAPVADEPAPSESPSPRRRRRRRGRGRGKGRRDGGSGDSPLSSPTAA